MTIPFPTLWNTTAASSSHPKPSAHINNNQVIMGPSALMKALQLNWKPPSMWSSLLSESALVAQDVYQLVNNTREVLWNDSDIPRMIRDLNPAFDDDVTYYIGELLKAMNLESTKLVRDINTLVLLYQLALRWCQHWYLSESVVDGMLWVAMKGKNPSWKLCTSECGQVGTMDFLYAPCVTVHTRIH